MFGRYRSILITGASSGIGRAIALAFAEPGVHLALVGRDDGRLVAAANDCRARGAEVSLRSVDVRAADDIRVAVGQLDDHQPFDLAVLSAGITSGLAPERAYESAQSVRAVMAVNLLGVLNTCEPLIERMVARRHGRIAFMGSLAGYRGLPYSPAYCATKGAIHLYAEALRGGLAPHGVRVTLIAPGFVRTPLNAAFQAPMPLAMSDTEAARRIRDGLNSDRDVIAFPRRLRIALALLRLLPHRLVDRVLMRANVVLPETGERMPPPDGS